MNIVVAYNKPWYQQLITDINSKYPHINIYVIQKKEQLTAEKLTELEPKYIFFPHWSWIIPAEIYETFQCVVFHMTNLPFGRGGSPLQNLVARGIYETKVSALQCIEELDAGPVFVKMDLSLYGNAEEIYMRASSTITKMIEYIIENEPEAVPQSGEVTTFNRRKKSDGNISELQNLEEVFDYIRMLDAEGYPRAFIEIGKFRLEFERSSLKLGEVHADVRIQLKEEE